MVNMRFFKQMQRTEAAETETAHLRKIIEQALRAYDAPGHAKDSEIAARMADILRQADAAP